MPKKLKRPSFYPVKTAKGFVIKKTFTPERELGFAIFRKKRNAKAMGKIWY